MEMDDIIENDVCNRLIRLSCAKMVNSKNERGGSKLHRNLLILHLLRKAKTEQQRPTNASISVVVPEVVPVANIVTQPSEEIEEAAALHRSGSPAVILEAPTVVGDGDSTLLDLSNSIVKNTTSHELVEICEDEGYTTVDNEFLQIPFGGEMMVSLEQVAKPEDQAGPSTMPCSTIENFSPYFDSRPTELDKSEEEQSSSSGSDEEENNESQPRHRKRKTSISRSSYPSTAKKFCVEERQLTGLISVFNSGLSVVADQLLPRSGLNPLLQQNAEQSVPSLVRLAYNPLICK